MIKGETSKGFKYSISEKLLESYDFLDTVSQVEDNVLNLPKLVKLLFGKDAGKFINHLRGEDGLVSQKAVSDTILEIFNKQKELKKS
jgi:hypothetical protein